MVMAQDCVSVTLKASWRRYKGPIDGVIEEPIATVNVSDTASVRA
jgi:hypothetical protein